MSDYAHKDKALSAIAAAWDAPAGGPAMQLLLAEAQVHAALAMAEALGDLLRVGLPVEWVSGAGR